MTGLFFHILGIIIPVDFHMFQRGRVQPPTRNWGFRFVGKMKKSRQLLGNPWGNHGTPYMICRYL